MSTKTLVKQHKLRHPLDLATASVRLIKDESPDKPTKFTVIQSLPAGWDIAPDAWRFRTIDAALNRFSTASLNIQAHGYKIQP